MVFKSINKGRTKISILMGYLIILINKGVLLIKWIKVDYYIKKRRD